MPRTRAAAGATLVVALGLILLPGAAASRTPAPGRVFDAALLQPVSASELRAVAAPGGAALDPTLVSDAALVADDAMLDPAALRPVPARAAITAPNPAAGVVVIPTWRTDPEISWYGPGFYGNRTACGHAYTQTIMGVAHKSLPCGTRVTFRNGGRVVTLPVIDRGPYVAGRIFDLSAAACRALDHCYTGPIQYRLP